MSPCSTAKGTGDGDFSWGHVIQGEAAGPCCPGRRARISNNRPVDTRRHGGAWFIVIVLIGFVPDAVDEGCVVRAGTTAAISCRSCTFTRC